MRRTKAESKATAAAVLDVATTLLAEHGYAALRLDDVAAAAGVTRGAVHHHFATKRGLFTAAAARAQGAVGDAVAASADAEPDPWLGFVAGCEAFLRASTEPAARRILLVDAPAVIGWQAWREQDAVHSGRHLREALADLAAQGLLRPGGSSEATAALLSGAMNEAALWAASQEDLDRALDEAVDALGPLLSALRRTDGHRAALGCTT